MKFHQMRPNATRFNSDNRTKIAPSKGFFASLRRLATAATKKAGNVATLARALNLRSQQSPFDPPTTLDRDLMLRIFNFAEQRQR